MCIAQTHDHTAEKVRFMAKNDLRLMVFRDLATALSLLSRLPVPHGFADRAAGAAWAYPLAGLVIGTLAGLAGLAALWIGMPVPLAALVTLAASAGLTGALHEDGLTDCADGFWGGWTRTDRLEIMKDSRTGTFGVLALFLVLSARWSALWLLFQSGPGTALAGIIAAATLSRGSMPVLMSVLPPARKDGLSRRVGKVPGVTAATAAGLGCAACLVLTGSFVALIWAAMALLAVGLMARSRIGGQTGDVLGAAQQLTELAVLIVLAA